MYQVLVVKTFVELDDLHLFLTFSISIVFAKDDDLELSPNEKYLKT